MVGLPELGLRYGKSSRTFSNRVFGDKNFRPLVIFDLGLDVGQLVLDDPLPFPDPDRIGPDRKPGELVDEAAMPGLEFVEDVEPGLVAQPDVVRRTVWVGLFALPPFLFFLPLQLE